MHIDQIKIIICIHKIFPELKTNAQYRKFPISYIGLCHAVISTKRSEANTKSVKCTTIYILQVLQI